MKYLLFILFPVFLYCQNSKEVLQQRTQELLNDLNQVKMSVDSLKSRLAYYEHIIFDTLVLRWSCSDPEGDPLTYDVYFGTDSISPPYVATVPDTFYQPGERLDWSTTYYWYIVAKDDPTWRDPNLQSKSSSGPLWHFTTMPVPERK